MFVQSEDIDDIELRFASHLKHTHQANTDDLPLTLLLINI